jgi:hypothetical protein
LGSEGVWNGTCLGDVHCCVGLIEQSWYGSWTRFLLMRDLVRGYTVKSSFSLLQWNAHSAAVTTTGSDDFSIAIRQLLCVSFFMPDYRQGLLWWEEACWIQDKRDDMSFKVILNFVFQLYFNNLLQSYPIHI